jgi:hypothetical protein
MKLWTNRKTEREIASEVSCCAILLASLDHLMTNETNDHFHYSYIDQSFLLQAGAEIYLTCSKTGVSSLMFVPCIIRHSRNNRHYALNCTTPLFYILAPTCFSSSLPSSESFLGPSELLEIQIK